MACVVEAASGASGVMSLASCVAVDSSAAPPAAAEVEEEGAGVGAGVPAETLLCALISGDPQWVVKVVSTGSSE